MSSVTCLCTCCLQRALPITTTVNRQGESIDRRTQLGISCVATQWETHHGQPTTHVVSAARCPQIHLRQMAFHRRAKLPSPYATAPSRRFMMLNDAGNRWLSCHPALRCYRFRPSIQDVLEPGTLSHHLRWKLAVSCRGAENVKYKVLNEGTQTKPPLEKPSSQTISSVLSHIISIHDMSALSPPSSFTLLFEYALQDYENQTGTKLVDHPLAKQLESCHSLDSITAILHEQARSFREFRGDDGRIMKSVKCTVNVLYTLSTSTVLGGSISLPFPPANAIFAGLAVLLAAVKDVSASYDALLELFESIENFLSRLDIYTRIPTTPAMTDILVKIIIELLSTLALATKQVKQGRPKKFIKKLLGENDIEVVLQRLDRLTLDEARTTGAETLKVVYGLVEHMRVVMDGEKVEHGLFLACF
ncbi:hypothetical protein BJV74DRAFT_797820 [Russula compacta]|nr:hypothetical protein BJV74DRAFT_797820 [Russula compacta]